MRRFFMGIVAACVVLTTAGCGGGGGNSSAGVPGSGPSEGALRIEEPSLVTLSLDMPMETVALTALGGAEATWSLDGGALPPGIQLTAGGVLHGTPTARGVYAFDVRAVLGTTADVLRLGLAVDAFGVYAARGLVAGDAVADASVHLRAVGGTGDIEFTVIGAGEWLDRDRAAARGVFRPGTPRVPGELLIVRAVDAAGAEAELELVLRPDVTAGFEAEWGLTDVWHLDFELRLGSHEYATDLHHALVVAGLRDPQSTDALGTLSDRMAAHCLKVLVHREMSRLFLRERNGAAGSEGLAISFAFEQPGVGYLKPAPGTYMGAGARRFSVMAFGDGTRGGVVGTAYVDHLSNPQHENDTSSPGRGEFGVFINAITSYFNVAFANYTLPDAPIEAADLDVLQAILYGEPISGSRAHEVERVLVGLAHSYSVVCAHEIGHSLGFTHTRPSASGSLMNAHASIGPGRDPTFLEFRIAQLRAVLPGPSRGAVGFLTGPAAPPAASFPGGGIEVCGHCNLTLRGAAQPCKSRRVNTAMANSDAKAPVSAERTSPATR